MKNVALASHDETIVDHEEQMGPSEACSPQLLQMSPLDFFQVDDQLSVAYGVIHAAPSTESEAIEYYLTELVKFALYREDELAVIHLALAKLHFDMKLYLDKEQAKDSNRDGNFLRSEKVVRHLRNAMLYFSQDNYPVVYGTLCIAIAQTMRQQCSIIANSRFQILRRGLSRADCLQTGMDLLEDSMSIFFRLQSYPFEHAVCCLEGGLFRLLQLQNQIGVEINDDESRIRIDLAIRNLEDAQHQLDIAISKQPNYFSGNLSLIPGHAIMILSGRNPKYLGGLIQYLLGRLNYPHGGGGDSYAIARSLRHYTSCLKKSHLPESCSEHADALYRVGVLIMEYPDVLLQGFEISSKTQSGRNYDQKPAHEVYSSISSCLINPNNSKHIKHSTAAVARSEEMYSERHYQAFIPYMRNAASAVRTLDLDGSFDHTSSTSQCRGLLPFSRCVDILFSLAQINICRLSILNAGDTTRESGPVMPQHTQQCRVVLEELNTGLSEVVALLGPQGNGPSTPLDSHILFYSSIKLLEFHSFHTAHRGPRPPEWDKGQILDLESSVQYAVGVLKARSIVESYDLHFICTAHLAQLSLNWREQTAPAAVGKALLSLSAAVNRAAHTHARILDCVLADSEYHMLLNRLDLVVGLGVLSASTRGKGGPVWSKRHAGATTLTLSGSSPGYANWCFEEGEGVGSVVADTPHTQTGAFIPQNAGGSYDTYNLKLKVAPAFNLDLTGMSLGRRMQSDRAPNLPVISRNPVLSGRRQRVPYPGEIEGGRGSALKGSRSEQPSQSLSSRLKTFCNFEWASKPSMSHQVHPEKEIMGRIHDSIGGDNILQLFASPTCLYTAALCTRQMRLQLVLMAARLGVTQGERASVVLNTVPSREAAHSYTTLCNSIRAECEVLSALNAYPQSHGEFSRTSAADVAHLTESHRRLHCLLEEQENVLTSRSLITDDVFLLCSSVCGGVARNRGLLADSMAGGAGGDAAATPHSRTSHDGIDDEDDPHTLPPVLEVGSGGGPLPVRGPGDFGPEVLGNEEPKCITTEDKGEGRGEGSIEGRGEGKEMGMKSTEKDKAKKGRESEKSVYALCRELDGTARSDLRGVLGECLGDSECVLMFCLPVSLSSGGSKASTVPTDQRSCLTVVLAWKGVNKVIKGKDGWGEGMWGRKAENSKPGNIYLEMARSDADESMIYRLLQAYLDALNTHPAARRDAQLSDVIRAMSAAFALGELLALLPPYVDCLAICCPPILRLVPWHLLLIEVPASTVAPPRPPPRTSAAPNLSENQKVKLHSRNRNNMLGGTVSGSGGVAVIFLIEKFAVRLGPSLSLWELCCDGVRRIHTASQGRGQGEGERSADADGTFLCVVNGEETGAGPKGDGEYSLFDLEVSCVTTLLAHSKNVLDECAVLTGPQAAPSALSTAPSVRKAKKRRALPPLSIHTYKRHARREEHQTTRAAGSDDATQRFTRECLSSCRILHLCVKKHHVDPALRHTAQSAAISLPRDPGHPQNRKKHRSDLSPQETPDRRNSLSSADIVRQLYLKNCALCVLSRYVLTDGLTSIRKRECELAVELLDALHLAGANTLLYPLFGSTSSSTPCSSAGGDMMSAETLGQILVLLKIYSIVPSLPGSSRATAVATRTASLWLRNASCDDVTLFLMQMDLSALEMGALLLSLKGLRKGPEGGEGGGDVKLFSHPYYWGAFCVSGHGGGVLSPSDPGDKDWLETRTESGSTHSTESRYRSTGKTRAVDRQKARDLKDETNIRFEIAALRSEGKREEAARLQRGLANLHRAQITSLLAGVAHTGSRAKDWIVSKLRQLDLVLLAQDSDSDSDQLRPALRGAATSHTSPTGFEDNEMGVGGDKGEAGRRSPSNFADGEESKSKGSSDGRQSSFDRDAGKG